MDINHVHLAVKDVAISSKFYQTFFGFKEAVRHGELQFLENRDGFHLALDPIKDAEALPKWFHLGMRLKSAAEVEALFSKFEKSPSYVHRKLERHPGHVFFYGIDPDGYRYEIYWEE